MTASKLNVPPPPRAKSAVSRLPAPAPAPDETPDNLSVSSDGYAFLSVKISPALRKKFKVVGAQWGLNNKELFEAMFNEWVDRHGERPKD